MAENPFEIPQNLRQLAENNIDQARVGYTQFMEAMTQAMNMWLNAMPQNEMTAAFKAMQERAIRFGKQNAEAGLNLASELANARDFQDALAVQSRYAQTQMQNYALQAQELGRLMARAAQTMQPRS
jgi:hypothetical protein